MSYLLYYFFVTIRLLCSLACSRGLKRFSADASQILRCNSNRSSFLYSLATCFHRARYEWPCLRATGMFTLCNSCLASFGSRFEIKQIKLCSSSSSIFFIIIVVELCWHMSSTSFWLITSSRKCLQANFQVCAKPGFNIPLYLVVNILRFHSSGTVSNTIRRELQSRG